MGVACSYGRRILGLKRRYVGIDIDPRCEEYEEEQITIYTQDQRKIVDSPKLTAFVHSVCWRDIIIDDGSHVDDDQAISFKALWPHLEPGGVYLIEDCHDHYPLLECGHEQPLVYTYPWVIVLEKPKRIVTGKPSRPLNQDEQAAYESFNLHTDL